MPPATAVVRNHKILGADAEQAGFARRGAAAELRPDFVRPQRHQIHRRRADEGGDEGGRGLLVDVERVADLLDLAAVHHHQNIGERHRLELVVGDVDRGGVEPALQFADLDPHRDAQLGVEVRQRFVEQEHLRLPHDGAAHRDALALAAGELPRLAVEHRRRFRECARLPGRGCRSRAWPCRGCAGHRPCCCRRSYADRARNSGTPWRCRARPARSG